MSGTTIRGATALVTGANRGIGRAIATALLDRGATKVHATARDTKQLTDLVERYGDRVAALELDVTDAERVDDVVAQIEDLQILVNNAGIALAQDLMADSIVDQARLEMEVNYFAPLRLLQRLHGSLAAGEGGAVVNLVSVGGLTNFPFFPTYSASKAAAHSLTQAARALLASRGVTVHGVYPGPVDTDMARGIDMDKATPRSVASAILDAIEAGEVDVYPDPFAAGFAEQFESSPKESERQIAAMVAEAPTSA